MKQNMKKFLLASSVFFAAVFLITENAFAAAKRAPLYNSPGYTSGTCANGADDTSGPTFGFVVIDINTKGELSAEVTLKGATPNKTYDIWVNQDPGRCPMAQPTAAGALKTDDQGNGNARVVVGIHEEAENFWVSVTRDNFTEVLRSTAVTPSKTMWKLW